MTRSINDYDPTLIKFTWNTSFPGRVRGLVYDLEDAGYEVELKERQLGLFSKRQEVVIRNTGNKKFAYALLRLARSGVIRLKDRELDWAMCQLNTRELAKYFDA